MLRYSLLSLAWILILAPTHAPGQEIDYTRQIKPLLNQHCADCHGIDLQEGGFRVDTGGLVVRGGDRGVSVVAGKPDESLILKVLQGEGEIPQMPLESDPLTDTQIKLIRDWIAQGAKLSEEEASTKTARIPSAFIFSVRSARSLALALLSVEEEGIIVPRISNP